MEYFKSKILSKKVFIYTALIYHIARYDFCRIYQTKHLKNILKIVFELKWKKYSGCEF